MLQICTAKRSNVNANMKRDARGLTCNYAGMADKEDLRAWYQAVLDATGWSAKRWAEEAKTTPTNITRLLSRPETASVPRIDTLLKLARAVPETAGVTPPMFIRVEDVADAAAAKAVGRSPREPDDGVNLWTIIESAFDIAKAEGSLQQMTGRDFRRRVEITASAFEIAWKQHKPDSQTQN